METVSKTRVTSSVNETKPLSTSDKTEKGLPRVDTSAIAAPMKMVKPNKTRVDSLPLTPPDEKQRSVSFDLLSNAVLHIPYDNPDTNYYNDYNGFATSPAESIDIAVRELSEDICVSLLRRHTEMKDVFARNQEFFDTLKQVTFEDEESWEDFLKVLYSKRDEKPDPQWMDEISEILSANPPFLVTFKQIIGYYEGDDDNNSNNEHDSNSTESSREDYEDEDIFDSCVINEPVYIDITPIRNYPSKLENLEINYPQFFHNAKELLCKERKRRGSALGGNHLGDDNPLLHSNHLDAEPEDTSETLYDEFKRILTTPKNIMDDDEWETSIYECLDPWPQLIDQFEEMLIPEIPE